VESYEQLLTGTEVSKYREGEDQYPIQLRYNDYQRDNIDRLINLKITYRDMNTGLFASDTAFLSCKHQLREFLWGN